MERLLDYFVPEKYELDLGINKFDKKIGGTVAVFGEAKKDTIISITSREHVANMDAFNIISQSNI